MNKNKLFFFKQLLIEERKRMLTERTRLWDSITHSTEQRGEQSSGSDEITIDGSFVADQEKNYQFLARDDRYLLKIDEALQRIEKGAYGICRGCGQMINEDRLRAVPITSFCVACKNKASRSKRISLSDEQDY